MRSSLLLSLLALGLVLVHSGPLRAGDASINDDDDFDPAVAASYASQIRTQTPPATATRPASSRPRPSSSGLSSYVRLARAPNMFGDSNQGGPQVQYQSSVYGHAAADVPLGGGRTFNVSENNKALPMDRVFFNYNGYQNAVSFTPPTAGMPVPRDANLNQYTFGFEKTFVDGTWSIDVRMPITDGFQDAANGFAINSGRYGNLSTFLKHMFYQDDTLALSAGLGVGLPTGSNLDMRVDGAPLTIQNDATHLLPFLGFFSTPGEDWFFQGFFDLDFATNGNDVVLGSPGQKVGRLNEQNLMHASLSLGRWLYRDFNSRYMQGLASVFELHYTSTIQDADTVNFTNGGSPGSFTNPANRLDLLNLTVGVQWQITAVSNFRVGCVVPLRLEPERTFDSEIQASFNRFF